MMATQRSSEAAARILAMVECVPEGFVATYGQIAQEAGLRRRARLVGKVLSELPESSKLPWHRIVNASGQISLREGRGYTLQQKRLQLEGIQFSERGRINLKQFGWRPTW